MSKIIFGIFIFRVHYETNKSKCFFCGGMHEWGCTRENIPVKGGKLCVLFAFDKREYTKIKLISAGGLPLQGSSYTRVWKFKGFACRFMSVISMSFVIWRSGGSGFLEFVFAYSLNIDALFYFSVFLSRVFSSKFWTWNLFPFFLKVFFFYWIKINF